MKKYICEGGQCTCNYASKIAEIKVALSDNALQDERTEIITGDIWRSNMGHFEMGECSSISNPSVVSATSAAMGVLTPMPCYPVSTLPFTHDSTNMIIDDKGISFCVLKGKCSWGGMIEIKLRCKEK